MIIYRYMDLVVRRGVRVARRGGGNMPLWGINRCPQRGTGISLCFSRGAGGKRAREVKTKVVRGISPAASCGNGD